MPLPVCPLTHMSLVTCASVRSAPLGCCEGSAPSWNALAHTYQPTSISSHTIWPRGPSPGWLFSLTFTIIRPCPWFTVHEHAFKRLPHNNFIILMFLYIYCIFSINKYPSLLNIRTCEVDLIKACWMHVWVSGWMHEGLWQSSPTLFPRAQALSSLPSYDSEQSHLLETIYCVCFSSYAIGLKALTPPFSFLKDVLK